MLTIIIIKWNILFWILFPGKVAAYGSALFGRASRHGARHRRRLSISPSTIGRAERCCRLSQSNNEERGKRIPNEEVSLEVLPSITGVTLKVALDKNNGLYDAAIRDDPTVPARFTSSASLDRVHRIRRDVQAVLVGRTTVQVDNPSLLVRRGIPIEPENQPLRAIIDPQLQLFSGTSPSSSWNVPGLQVFQDGNPTVVYYDNQGCEHMDIDRLRQQLSETTALIGLPRLASSQAEKATRRQSSSLCMSTLLQDLRQRFQVQHVLVEGGLQTARSFLEQKLVDRALLIRAVQVEFLKPGLTWTSPEHDLRQAGLVLFEEEGVDPFWSSVDQLQAWVRPSEHWPGESLALWP